MTLDVTPAKSFVLSGARPHYSPDRVGQVEHICLDLTLDLETQACWGQCHIHLRPLHSQVRQLRLNAVGQQIQSVTVQHQPQAFHYDGEFLDISLDASLGIHPDQVLVITIDYRLQKPQRGLYFVATDPPQAWTQGEDEDSRYWFPCFDSPGQLATSEVRARVRQPLQAISNGELRACYSEGEWQIFHWYQPQVHPTYLMTLAVGDFAVFDDQWQGKPVTYYVAKDRAADARRTLGKTPKMMDFFSRIYGYPYPYPKYAQVCVADFIFGGMENTSTTLLTDRCLLDERAAAEDFRSESLVAHELAHQWFGDLVVIKHWSHAWIKEGMASYAEVLWFEEEYGADFAAYYRLGELRNYLSEDSDRYRRPIVTHVYREAIELYDRHLYEKGACVYHMIRQELGEEQFWKAIQTFVQTYAHQTVETVDLLRAIEMATGRNLLPLFDQYVFRGGHPDFHVSYRWEVADQLAVLTVKQQQVTDGVTPLERNLFDLRIPVGIGTVDDQGQVTVKTIPLRIHEPEHTFYLPLPQQPTFVSFDAGNHTLKTVTLEYPLPELKAQLQYDPDVLGRVQAAIALGKKGNLEVVQTLAAALQREPFWGVRREIAKVLGTIQLDQSLEALRLALTDSHPHVRAAAVEAIAGFKSAKAYELLKPIAKHGDPSYSVEAAALKGIGVIAAAKPQPKPKLEKVLKRLRKALEKRQGWNEVVRCGAIAGLGQLKASPEAVNLVLDYTAIDVPQPLRLAAIRTLGTIGDRHHPQLQQILERLEQLSHETFFFTQMAVVQALSQIDHPQVLGLLQQLGDRTTDGRIKRSVDEGIAKVQKALGSDDRLKTLETTLNELQKENQTLKSRLEELEARTKATQQDSALS
ncbi:MULTISPECIES: M1 family metallopeptidase [unclassified Thermosynechococcus]|uniref:M1 family metallopeptidase n=1 Tax=unclassified Thermosynechococcus TaxID=2622553 RepID=UPI00267220E3|nr:MULTISPECIES: M1 family metallopeptidase [unclassified Thermosynechococcus]WKT84354.1 M1 family metallopeptidase [Thermosynechococcus sp. HY596]WNC63488.1 M1 family metallopeptidase [Thermosynechococcus sp. HY591]WNC66048.1 M1 family metallopeptidase [Thermosynechococcus sp. HY593]